MANVKDDFASDRARITGFDALKAEMKAAKYQKHPISPEQVETAIDTAVDSLRTGWTTGGGRRLQRFVWSLWNGYHFINLFELSHSLEREIDRCGHLSVSGCNG
jgi:hypothetical protein